MLISFTVDDWGITDTDKVILEAEDYLSHKFKSEVKIEIPSQTTTDSYRNPFPTYCDMDEEDIPF